MVPAFTVKSNLGEEINSEKEKVLEFTKYYKALYQTSNPSEAQIAVFFR